MLVTFEEQPHEEDDGHQDEGANGSEHARHRSSIVSEALRSSQPARSSSGVSSAVSG
ncbi:hypothetical protein RAZWK3B_05427 [Roseobacter sp. AzwK-3b]|nr:hypothetical protein RAZWK3B_05427 [Roseobacter sp. AzwK-3b]